MLGFGAKLPLSDEMRLWVDEGFLRLEKILGRDRMLNAEMILPDDDFFPDRYDGSRESVQRMALRIAKYMGVDADSFEVHVYAENEDAWREDLMVGKPETRDAAGLYFHERNEGRFVVGLHAKQLNDPLALAATTAHELAHVLLLGGGLMERNSHDMEPMTDLCTVFLGMGFFTASSSFQFKKWSKDRYEGWSVSRKGYLTEELWGYALARFAKERGELQPKWAQGLPTNVRAYFERSSKWLAKADWF